MYNLFNLWYTFHMFQKFSEKLLETSCDLRILLFIYMTLTWNDLHRYILHDKSTPILWDETSNQSHKNIRDKFILYLQRSVMITQNILFSLKPHLARWCISCLILQWKKSIRQILNKLFLIKILFVYVMLFELSNVTTKIKC